MLHKCNFLVDDTTGPMVGCLRANAKRFLFFACWKRPSRRNAELDPYSRNKTTQLYAFFPLHSNKCEQFSIFDGQASKCYRNALNWIQERGYADEDEETLGQQLCLKLHLNLALTSLKLNKPKITCIECKEALSINPHDPKALYRYFNGFITCDFLLSKS